MQYRFEAETEASHFHWVFLFNALLQHADALPVFLAEDGIIVGIDRRPLLPQHNSGLVIMKNISMTQHTQRNCTM